jgi:DNA-binding MarR family transcriptional regulator
MKTSERSRRPRQAAVLSWLRLARIYQKISADSERRFKQHKLSTAQFDVLTHIGARPGLSQQELAASLLVTKGNISQLLDRMEGEGLVVRRHEGRRNCLDLTDAGRALYSRAVPAQEAAIGQLLAALSADEQRQLLDLLRRVDHSIGRER